MQQQNPQFSGEKNGEALQEQQETQRRKRELRKKMIPILDSISETEIENQGRPIFFLPPLFRRASILNLNWRIGTVVRSKLMSSRIYKESKSICTFISFKGEINTFPIIYDILKDRSGENGDAKEQGGEIFDPDDVLYKKKNQCNYRCIL